MIHDLATPYSFDAVDLSSPFNKNGSYFIKLGLHNNPIYIQSPKCFVKSGMMKSGKKMFCDLVFSHENENLISWLEGLEETCKKRIFQNRTKWFENDLEEHEIENYLTSPYKIIKSGKQYVMRVNVPMLIDKCELKIYDEQEMEIPAEELKENTDVVTILEFKGIRCSVRSFQFEIELKQMLVVAPVKLFEKCVIHVDRGVPSAVVSAPVVAPPAVAPVPQIVEHRPVSPLRVVAPPETELVDAPTTPVVMTDLVSSPPAKTDEMVELDDFEIDLDDAVETLQLRKRDDVYYKMYKEAKRKAKEAKILALSNYLEAKRIKSTYLLNDEISDDENDDGELEEEMKQLSAQL